MGSGSGVKIADFLLKRPGSIMGKRGQRPLRLLPTVAAIEAALATQKASIGKVETGQDPSARVTALRQTDDFDRDVWSVLGVPIDRLDTSGALAIIEQALRDRRRLSFVTPNVNSLVRAIRDVEERWRIIDSDLCLVDGAPLVAIGRLLGMKSLTRCAGSDIFEALRRRPAFAGRRLRVFFFGGRDGAAEAAAKLLTEEDRGLEAAGWLNPGFADVAAMSAPGIIDVINEADPDFLVVALGASKGQAWIDANLGRLTAPVVAHLGAVVDFTAGTIIRAPVLMRQSGLEWAWRIYAEPSLWRRYWGDAFSLAWICASKLVSATRRMHWTGRPGAASMTFDGVAARISLSGDLSADHLESVRTAFRAANRTSSDVILDFSQVGAIDAAFLGQLLMLEKAVRQHSVALKVAGASPAIRRILKAHSLIYPEASPMVAPTREPGEAGIAAVS